MISSWSMNADEIEICSIYDNCRHLDQHIK